MHTLILILLQIVKDAHTPYFGKIESYLEPPTEELNLEEYDVFTV